MWGPSTAQATKAHCKRCGRAYDPKGVLFRCPEARCPVRDRPPGDPPSAWVGKPIFRAKQYAWSVPCPVCSRPSYVKHCPHCWEPLPLTPGNDSTIGLVGASVSGKTCYMAGLIRQIKRRLSREDAYRMSLEWEDQAGRDHFRRLENEIYVEGIMPEGTQHDAEGSGPPSLQVTIRFPARRSWLGGESNAVVSLEMPDRGGEVFQRFDDPSVLAYLENARAVVLIVDQLMSEPYREQLAKRGEVVPEPRDGAADTLGSVVQCIRRATQQHRGKLKRQLAVVLGKCDLDGLFDPDAPDWGGRFPVQGAKYDPKLAAEVSRQVVTLLEDELALSDVVAMARANFEDVSFFAVTAFGTAPRKVPDEYGGEQLRLFNARPRRVEEPLLWILHRWGYL